MTDSEQHGELWVNPAAPGEIDDVGIDDIAPTIKGTASVGGMVIDRRWSTIEMGLGVLDEVYLRYKVHIPAELASLTPMSAKLSGLFGAPHQSWTPLAAGGERPDGAWSVRVIMAPGMLRGTYIYAEDPNDEYPHGVANSRRAWQPGWNDVLIHVKMNTPGVTDGVCRLWINGAPVSRHVVQWIPEGYTPEQSGIYLTGPLVYFNEWVEFDTPLEFHLADFELLVPT